MPQRLFFACPLPVPSFLSLSYKHFNRFWCKNPRWRVDARIMNDCPYFPLIFGALGTVWLAFSSISRLLTLISSTSIRSFGIPFKFFWIIPGIFVDLKNDYSWRSANNYFTTSENCNLITVTSNLYGFTSSAFKIPDPDGIIPAPCQNDHRFLSQHADCEWLDRMFMPLEWFNDLFSRLQVPDPDGTSTIPRHDQRFLSQHADRGKGTGKKNEKIGKKIGCPDF